MAVRAWKRNLAALLVAAANAGFAAAEGVWDASFDPVKKERFIPVELWTGAEWDGARELKMAPADTRFGDRGHKRIKGPVEWKHPKTGQTFVVYERTLEEEKGGVKFELFAMNEAKSGLGRVYDSRTSLGVRSFSGGLKFPLGAWKQGETRQLIEKRYEGGKIGSRMERITITKLDFIYAGAAHCLEFDWEYRDGAKLVDYQTYTYCPNLAMVKQVQH
ncbi:MAG TPA: hypothetical protein VGA73_16190 [Candidatus Binatia bacterium]